VSDRCTAWRGALQLFGGKRAPDVAAEALVCLKQ
jgi:hypothetical protein